MKDSTEELRKDILWHSQGMAILVYLIGASNRFMIKASDAEGGVYALLGNLVLICAFFVVLKIMSGRNGAE